MGRKERQQQRKRAGGHWDSAEKQKRKGIAGRSREPMVLNVREVPRIRTQDRLWSFGQGVSTEE